MSALPKIEPLQVLQRNNRKLNEQLAEATLRETHLELLAETLRDERDTALAEVEALKTQLDPTS